MVWLVCILGRFLVLVWFIWFFVVFGFWFGYRDLEFEVVATCLLFLKVARSFRNLLGSFRCLFWLGSSAVW